MDSGIKTEYDSVVLTKSLFELNHFTTFSLRECQRVVTCYIYVNIRCIVPLLDYEKLLVPGLHSGWLSAHVYCEYDNVTSGINCLLFFYLSQFLRGGGFMHAECNNIICMQMISKIYSVTEHNGRMQSRRSRRVRFVWWIHLITEF